MTQKLTWTLLYLSLGLLLTACPSSTLPSADTTKPTVSLTASPSSVTTAGNVTLSATATDAVGVTKVMFFEGSTRLGEDPSAPYTWTDPVTRAQNGTRSYSARAYDAAGNEGRSSAQNVTVNIPAPLENRNPLADFSTSSSGLVLSVTNSSSDPDGDPLTYAWNWGDTSPDSSGANPSHTYAAAGTYSVKLTASDGRGGNNVKTLSVTVSSAVGTGGVWDSSSWDGANFQ